MSLVLVKATIDARRSLANKLADTEGHMKELLAEVEQAAEDYGVDEEQLWSWALGELCVVMESSGEE